MIRRACVLALLALSACNGATEERPPNVLFISLDTLRADHLHCYGYERETSPNIDRLASEGVLFERTFSTTSWTLPSHLSMFTGLALSVHGVCDDRLWESLKDEKLPFRGELLAEKLKDAGYRTGGFYTAPYLDPKFGFGDGFDVYERIGHPVYSHPVHSLRLEKLKQAGDNDAIRAWRDAEPELFDSHRPTADEAVDAALEFIEQEGTAPFFCFLHIFDVHNDYVPPAPFDTMFDPDYTGSITGRRITSPKSPMRKTMAKEDLDHVIALYDGEIAWVNSQMGRLLARLDELELNENTLIVLTSDHGEEFFEHGHKTHRISLFTESLHVPLIMRLPDALPAGQRVAGSSGIVDIAPTVYSLTGVNAPAALNGIDLAPIARGEAPNSERDYISELLLFQQGKPSPTRKLSVLSGSRHAVYETRGGETILSATWDLDSDPDEASEGDATTEADRQRVEKARKLYAALRAASRDRGVDVQGLTDAERRELSAAGYAGTEDAPDAARGSERLCLDGCVWPDP